MTLFKTIETHADLMFRMADTVGADLGDALLAGTLNGQELRSAVMRCTCCEGAEECPGWLAAHETGADTAPTFCANREMLARLAE